jgi:glycosyltransferase involved in cell wall biosynthesis
MHTLRIKAPILWLFRPEMADVPGRYGERLLIYHIVDEYTGYSGFGGSPRAVSNVVKDGERAVSNVVKDGEGRRAAYVARERELIRKADLVLVTSRALLDSKSGLNPNTHWVPNGVDYARFSCTAEACRLGTSQEPPELRDLPRPRIGYVGAINPKVDVALLTEVADAYPQASLVLVGPVRRRNHSAASKMMMTSPGRRPGPASDRGARAGPRSFEQEIQRLAERPNVHLIGRVPGEAVASYTAACDVGLLPYVQNEWTRHIHPLKLYEYLACGLPVVSTDIPSVHEEARVVRIARSAAAFVAAVGLAIRETDAGLGRERQARAMANTWRQRVERISELIEAT